MSDSISISRYCKNANFKPDGTDYHGLEWKDRTILEVLHIDRPNNTLRVKNVNGLEWSMKLNHITFCNQNGDKL